MKKKGFTLIEILIACAILSISLSISLNLINAANKTLILSKENFLLSQEIINHKHKLLSLPYNSKELKKGLHKLNLKEISLTWEVKDKKTTKHVYIKIKKNFATENIFFIKTPK